MPNLLNRSKHEEFESNSALQIRNHKERRAEKAENPAVRRRVRKKFRSTVRNFRTGAKFLHCAKMLFFFPFDPHVDHFF